MAFRASDFVSPEALQGETAPTQFRASDFVNMEPQPTLEVSLADEFGHGVLSGTESLQATLFGVAALTGREFDIESLEKFGIEGVRRNQEAAAKAAPTIQSLSEIEGVGDFFRFAAGGIGQALPSLTSVVLGGGIGGVLAKKAIERQIRSTISNRMLRTMTKKGFTKKQALPAIDRALRGPAGQKMLLQGITRGTPNTQLIQQAFSKGSMRAAVGLSALPQIGQIDIELQAAGKNAGLTAVLGGIAGGFLEALPALRLLDKMFPGVDTAVSKSFVKDMAVGAGTQAVLEGSTEGAQEMIAIAALAYHDPSFDPWSPESALRVADSFAIGALVGTVTGAGAGAFGGTQQRTRVAAKAAAKTVLPAYSFEEEPSATLPQDFSPADVSFFKEIRTRVSAAVGSVLNPVMNTVRDQAQEGIDALDTQFKGRMNTEGKSISDIVKAAHNSFIAEHAGEIDRIRTFASKAAQSVYEQAQSITLPEAREKFVQDSLTRVRAQVEKLSSLIQKRVDKSSESIMSGISAFNELDDMLGRRPKEEVTDTAAELFSQTEETPVKVTFGKDKTGGIVRGENNLFTAADPDAARGWASKELARRQMLKTKVQFPSVPDSAWALKQKEDGSWVIEIATAEGNRLLTNDAQLNEGIEQARLSARGSRDPARPRAKIQSVTNPNQKTNIDLVTLAHAGRSLNEQSVTLRQGLITALGRVFDRGGISRVEFNRAIRAYDAAFPREKAAATKFNIGPEGQDPDVRLRDDINEPRDRKNAARDAELAREFVDPEAIPVGDEPAATGLENLPSAEQEARRAAREATVPAPVTKQPEKQPAVTVIASKESEAAMGKELKALVERFTKLLTKKDTTVTVVETRKGLPDNLPQNLKDLMGTLEYMIMEALSPASVHYALDGSNQVFIFIHDFTQNTAETTAMLLHELGHTVHYDTWQSLNKAEQDALWDAFRDDVAAGRTTGGAVQTPIKGFDNLTDPNTPAKLTIFEFREWMADQFVLWAAGRSKPTGALKSFFEKVGAKLQQLYDYIQKNPGRMGKLNETYAQFADAVARRAVGLNPPGVNYFIREGAAGRNMTSIASQALADVEVRGLNDIDLLIRKLEAVADTDIVASGIAAIPASQRAPLQQRMARYPVLIKNAEAVNKWMKNAWNLALAPATSVMRSIGDRVPVANEIANIFGRNIGQKKTSQNYHDRTGQMKGAWARKYQLITKGMSTVEKEALARRLQGLDGTDGKPTTLRERQMRKFFDDLLVYIRESGLPVAEVKNYFPRAFNYELMVNDEKKIIAHLQKKGMSLDNARGFYQSMLSPEMRDFAAVGRQAPAFKNMRSRTLTDPFFKQYQSETLDGIVSNYINGAVKRAEYNRFLGSKAPRGATRADDLRKSTWNPKGKLEAFYDKAKKQGATAEDLSTIQNYIDAQLGTLGRDNKFAQKGRKAMAAMLAYQNMRLLLFTVFASFPDLVGPAIRAGSMTAALKSLSGNMAALMKSENDIADMARAYGMISDEASNHIMTEYVDNNFMPPGLRKANEAFFKYTGLNWYTDFTRKMALVVGIDYIKTMAQRSTDPNARSRDRIKATAALQELGITKAAIDEWAANGEQVWGSQAYTKTGAAARSDQAVSESLVQFVNESIMRPNASQRPIMASHPNAMLVFHLKGYMFAMYEVVGKRLFRNMELAKTQGEVLNSVVMPVAMILALTMVGLELRELMQYAFTGRTPPSDRMDMSEYMSNILDRSGLLGQSQMAIDGASGDLAFLAGPTMGQLADLIERPGPTMARATPILSQMPSLRQMF